jgi:hypothetical protein
MAKPTHKMLSEMTRDELYAPEHRAAVLRRARYLKRRIDRLPVDAPLPRQTIDDAVDLICGYRIQQEREGAPARKTRRQVLSGNALRQRRHRLKKLAPSGVTPSVWAEIVDHFRGACATEGCTTLAAGFSRIPDGTPVPACIVHRAREMQEIGK